MAHPEVFFCILLMLDKNSEKHPTGIGFSLAEQRVESGSQELIFISALLTRYSSLNKSVLLKINIGSFFKLLLHFCTVCYPVERPSKTSGVGGVQWNRGPRLLIGIILSWIPEGAWADYMSFVNLVPWYIWRVRSVIVGYLAPVPVFLALRQMYSLVTHSP